MRNKRPVTRSEARGHYLRMKRALGSGKRQGAAREACPTTCCDPSINKLAAAARFDDLLQREDAVLLGRDRRRLRPCVSESVCRAWRDSLTHERMGESRTGRTRRSFGASGDDAVSSPA